LSFLELIRVLALSIGQKLQQTSGDSGDLSDDFGVAAIVELLSELDMRCVRMHDEIAVL
jgi:hypothetical protein